MTEIVKNEKVTDILNNESVKNIISEEMAKSEEKGQEVAEFISSNMEKIFNQNNQEIEQIEKIFDAVLSSDETKEDIERIFEIYSNWDTAVVNEALRNLDNELGQVSKPLRLIKSTLETGSTGFSKLMNMFKWDSDSSLIQDSVNGVRWKLNSISQSLENGHKMIAQNQLALSEITPKIAIKISKLKGMSNALRVVLENEADNLDDRTKNLFSNMVANMDSLAASQMSDLQQLSVIVGVNTSNKMMLTITEKKILSKITSSILVNFSAWTEQTIKNMVNSVDDALSKLDSDNENKVKWLMKQSEEEKLKVKAEIENQLAKIEDFSNFVSEHNEKMEAISKELNDFLPEYKERMQRAEEGVMQNFTEDSNAGRLLEEINKHNQEISTKE